MYEYSIFRKDRNGHGGGVLIGIDSNLTSVEVDCKTCTELLAVDIFYQKTRTLRIIVGYLADSKDSIITNRLLKEIELLINKNSNYIIFGDFNLPLINWKSKTFPNIEYYKYFEKFYLYNQPMHQLIDFPTRNKNILDLILTNNIELVKNIKPNCPISKSDHELITGNIYLPKDFTLKGTKFKQIKHFSTANYIKINHILNKDIITKTIQLKSAETAWEFFIKNIMRIIDSDIPKSNILIKNNKIYSKSSQILYNKMNRYYKKFKKTSNFYYLNLYKKAKSNYRNDLKKN